MIGSTLDGDGDTSVSFGGIARHSMDYQRVYTSPKMGRTRFATQITQSDVPRRGTKSGLALCFINIHQPSTGHFFGTSSSQFSAHLHQLSPPLWMSPPTPLLESNTPPKDPPLQAGIQPNQRRGTGGCFTLFYHKPPFLKASQTMFEYS